MNAPLDFNKFAHNVRSKLNGVLGLSQILLTDDLSIEQQKHISAILNCGHDILTLVDQQASIDGVGDSMGQSENEMQFETNIMAEIKPGDSCQVPLGQPVLVIDDEIENLNILVFGLSNAGYKVITANNPTEAFELLKKVTPAVILLDVNMPEMNGYDFCELIRQKKDFVDTPIIFLSGVTELQGRLKAYKAGGTDYVLKPFYVPEVLARVNTHMALIRSKRELAEHASRLEQMVQEKTEQLIHADRLVNLGVMSAGVAHEINNPLTYVYGNLNLLKKFKEELLPFIATAVKTHTEPQKIKFILQELPNTLTEMESGLKKITTIVAGLKTFSRQETSEKSEVDIVECLDEALMLVRSELKNKVEVKKNLVPPFPKIWANAAQLCQVFVNLFVNAKHAMADRQPGLLTIQVEHKASMILTNISDNGSGMSKEVLQKIWLPFFTTKPKGIGTGLGLSIVHGIIRDHKGQLEVQSEVGKGTTFSIMLPVYGN